MGNINNFDNVKPGTLALVENGIGGANAILVYLKGLQEVHGFTISAEGVIGCSRSVPHKCVIKAFGITCVDGGRIRDLLTELFTGSGTVCQDLYKIYEKSTKIVDMTIEEVSEIVSRQRGETVKVKIVEQCEESADAEVEDADTEKPNEGVYVSPGDTIEHNGKTIMAIASDEAECPRCCLNGEDCRGIDCMGDCGRTAVVFEEVDKDTETINDSACESTTTIYNPAATDDDKETTEKREWELSEHSYASIEPAVGDVVTVYGVRCTVVEGAGSCHKCEARANGCAFMDCTASDRQDSKYVYLEKIEDGTVTESSDGGNSEWSISEQDNDVVEPRLGTTGYVNGVKAVAADVSEIYGDNPCEHCVARGDGCCKVVCAGPNRGDHTSIYLRKAED